MDGTFEYLLDALNNDAAAQKRFSCYSHSEYQIPQNRHNNQQRCRYINFRHSITTMIQETETEFHIWEKIAMNIEFLDGVVDVMS